MRRPRVLLQSSVGFNPENRSGALCSSLSISPCLSLSLPFIWFKNTSAKTDPATKHWRGSWEHLKNSIPNVEMNNLRSLYLAWPQLVFFFFRNFSWHFDPKAVNDEKSFTHTTRKFYLWISRTMTLYFSAWNRERALRSLGEVVYKG